MIKQYVVDAFTDKIFHGNQAAVCVLDEWLSEELMMNITKENNFSETAFTVKDGDKYRPISPMARTRGFFTSSFSWSR